LGEESGDEPRLELPGVGPVQRRRRARKLGNFLSPGEEVVAQSHLSRDGVRLGLERSEVEEPWDVLRGVRLDRYRREQEHRERAASRPSGVVHLAERRDVVRVESRGPSQRFGERDGRERVGRRVGDGGGGSRRQLRRSEPGQHQSPSDGSGAGLRNNFRNIFWKNAFNHANTAGIVRYPTGTTNSASTVEKKIPPTIA